MQVKIGDYRRRSAIFHVLYSEGPCVDIVCIVYIVCVGCIVYNVCWCIIVCHHRYHMHHPYLCVRCTMCTMRNMPIVSTYDASHVFDVKLSLEEY